MIPLDCGCALLLVAVLEVEGVLLLLVVLEVGGALLLLAILAYKQSGVSTVII